MKVNVDNPKKIWKKHMEKLMNVEKEWSDMIALMLVRQKER